MRMPNFLKRFLASAKGEVTLSRAVTYAVTLLLVGVLLPIGLSEIANATTTNWNASVITIFQVLLPILAVVGVAIDFVRNR